MASNSPHTRGQDIVQEIRHKGHGYDLALDQWQAPPTAAELTAALAQYPPSDSTPAKREFDDQARRYLQTRAYVQANAEHAESMQELAGWLSAANRTGRFLAWVGIIFAAIQVGFAAAPYLF